MKLIIFGFVVFLIVVCVLIIVSILLQEDKSGGGIGMLGGSSQSFFGVSSGNFLSKLTTILLVVFFLGGIFVAILSSRVTGSAAEVSDIEKLQESELKAKVTEISPEDLFILEDETSDSTTD